MTNNFKSISIGKDARVLHLFFLVISYNYLSRDSLYYLPQVYLVAGAVLLWTGYFRVYLSFIAAMAAFLTWDLFSNFYVRPNHGFVILYISLFMVIGALFSQTKAYYARYAAVLFTIVMGFALLQKLTSENYMSGALMLTWLSNGKMFAWLIDFFHADWRQVTAEFRAQHVSEIVPQTNPTGLVPWGPLHLLAIAMTYVSLLLQLASEVIVVFRRRFEALVAPAVLIFVFSIYVVAWENTFLVMSLFLGLCMIDRKKQPTYFWLFVLAISYMVLSLQFGYRPFFLR